MLSSERLPPEAAKLRAGRYQLQVFTDIIEFHADLVVDSALVM